MYEFLEGIYGGKGRVEIGENLIVALWKTTKVQMIIFFYLQRCMDEEALLMFC